MTAATTDAGGAAAAPAAASTLAAAAAVNRVGMRLLTAAGGSGGADVLCAASIASAFAIVAGGATGATRDELFREFGWGDDAARVGLGAALREVAEAPAGADGAKVAVANMLLVDKPLPLRAAFLADAREAFGAEIDNSVDMRENPDEAVRRANAFVEKATDGCIRQIIRPPLQHGGADCAVIVLSAVHFKGLWETAFNPRHTAEFDFFGTSGTKKAKFMVRRNCRLRSSYVGKNMVVELDYKGGSEGRLPLTMVLVLPPKADDAAAAARDAMEAWLASGGLENGGPAETPATAGGPGLPPRPTGSSVNFFLPKFKIEAQYDLVTELKKLGVKRCFNDGEAEFDNLLEKKNAAAPSSRSFFVGAAVHKAVVDVDEEGTVAAGATALIMMTRAAPAPMPDVRFDRPFGFAICDRRTRLNLFIGIVRDV